MHAVCTCMPCAHACRAHACRAHACRAHACRAHACRAMQWSVCAVVWTVRRPGARRQARRRRRSRCRCRCGRGLRWQLSQAYLVRGLRPSRRILKFSNLRHPLRSWQTHSRTLPYSTWSSLGSGFGFGSGFRFRFGFGFGSGPGLGLGGYGCRGAPRPRPRPRDPAPRPLACEG